MLSDEALTCPDFLWGCLERTLDDIIFRLPPALIEGVKRGI